jgi:MYXO-CTERM domain-containing protein
MKKLSLTSSAAAVALLAALVNQAQAQVIISEVAPFGSGNTGNGADWFELTNTGSSAVNIAGWKVDDNSNSFAAALALTGVTSIAAGQSVVFIEVATSTTAAAVNAAFGTFWFGANVPSSLVIGNYSGSGIGLSQTSDAVNIFNASGTLVTRVDFGASNVPFTFDNTAGLNNVTLNNTSVVGVNGAFTSANAFNNVGSPGSIAAVPEAEGYAMALAGLGALGLIARRRKA